MAYKKIIPFINAENEVAASIINKAVEYEENGADEIFIYNYASGDSEREEFLSVVRTIIKQIEIPLIIGYCVNRFEDAKKALYTGAAQMVIPYRKLKNTDALKEAIGRFGSEKIILELDMSSEHCDTAFGEDNFINECIEMGVAAFLLKHLELTDTTIKRIESFNMPVIVRDSLTRNDMTNLFGINNVYAISTNYFEHKDIMKVKKSLKENGVEVNTFESKLSFSDLKANSDGLIPVIVQDYKTNEVLMLAYMNEQAFVSTIESGKMNYYSRSRNEQWLKGETSGHYQYVKMLTADCDNDTLLAKVKQIGAACHTGNYSCFFNNLFESEYDSMNPLTVLTEVYDVIEDRKKNPKEGSYTNYLFDKGIDKILKKCGEEATEIVIAAKNPDAEELKYEISDFLYHLMVLMSQCGVDWNDIIKELAHRRK